MKIVEKLVVKSLIIHAEKHNKNHHKREGYVMYGILSLRKL